MKEHKRIKKHKNEIIFWTVLGLIVVVTIIMFFVFGINGNYGQIFGYACNVLSIITVWIALRTWFIAKDLKEYRKEIYKNIDGKENVALFINVGSKTAQLAHMISYIVGEEKKIKDDNLSSQNCFGQILSVKKIEKTDKNAEQTLINEIPFLTQKIEWQLKNKCNSDWKITSSYYVKDNEKYGNIFGIEVSSGMPVGSSNEINEFIVNMVNTVCEIVNLSKSQVLHIFYAGPAVIPFYIANQLSNSVTMYAYHYQNGNYICSGEVEKNR